MKYLFTLCDPHVAQGGIYLDISYCILFRTACGPHSIGHLIWPTICNFVWHVLTVYLCVCVCLGVCVCVCARARVRHGSKEFHRIRVGRCHMEVEGPKRSNAETSSKKIMFTAPKRRDIARILRILDVDNIKVRSISARHPSKMKSWVQSWRLSTNKFCVFCPSNLS